jgi:hypothetical protein
MFLVCGVGVSEKESFPLHKVITRGAPDPPKNLSDLHGKDRNLSHWISTAPGAIVIV